MIISQKSTFRHLLSPERAEVPGGVSCLRAIWAHTSVGSVGIIKAQKSAGCVDGNWAQMYRMVSACLGTIYPTPRWCWARLRPGKPCRSRTTTWIGSGSSRRRSRPRQRLLQQRRHAPPRACWGWPDLRWGSRQRRRRPASAPARGHR